MLHQATRIGSVHWLISCPLASYIQACSTAPKERASTSPRRSRAISSLRSTSRWAASDARTAKPWTVSTRAPTAFACASSNPTPANIAALTWRRTQRTPSFLMVTQLLTTVVEQIWRPGAYLFPSALMQVSNKFPPSKFHLFSSYTIFASNFFYLSLSLSLSLSFLHHVTGY